MARRSMVGIKMDEMERKALERAAVADHRTISGLARKVLMEWLSEHGWLGENADAR